MKRVRFNNKQKKIILSAIAVIGISFIVWLFYGGEILTKTQVLVDIKDELFDTTYKEWQDKFIWGLDLSLMITGTVTAASLILLFLFRTKKPSMLQNS